MKKTKLFGLALIATMASFTACTNDSEEVLAQESEIKLTSEIMPSRAASNLQSTQIVAGQEVGVTITGIKEGQEHNNIAWSVGDNGALTNTGDAVYYGDGTATITAYHPYNSTWTGTSHEFSVSTDQSTNAEYLASDLLWATATSTKTENPVPLTFSHKLAKINVTLVPENEDDDLNGATISIYNTKTSTTFNPTTGAISTATGEAQEIIAGVTADDVYTASAIVIPQEVSGKFIKITHEGKTYYYTLSSAKTLEAGTSYSYTLTVKGKQLINTGSSINPWNPDSEEGEEGDAEEDVSKLTVTLTEAGTLGNYLTDANKDIVEELKIIGEINAKDIQLIRKIAVVDNFCKPTSETGALSILDLSEAKIVAGGGTYTCETVLNDDNTCNHETRDNVVTEGMFEYTNLKEVILPNTITEIAHSAFECLMRMTKFVVPEGVTTIGEQAFNTCYNFESIVLPESVETIGSRAFDDCDKMKEITIPSKVTELSNELLVRCNLLEKVNLPDGITTIGNGTFGYCPNLKTIEIPQNVTKMGYDVFAQCTALKEIHCKATTPPVAQNGDVSIFRNFTKSECTLYVPTGSLNAYKNSTEWKGFKNIIGE